MDAIERLTAIEKIKQLKARYFRLMDTRDFDAMAMVFSRDAKFDCSEGGGVTDESGNWQGPVGPVTQGRRPIIEWITRSFVDSTSVHHGHCHEIVIDGATEAHGVIAMEDFIRTLDRATLLVHGAGHYHERYCFEDGQWRICATKLTRLYLDRFDEPRVP